METIDVDCCFFGWNKQHLKNIELCSGLTEKIDDLNQPHCQNLHGYNMNSILENVLTVAE